MKKTVPLFIATILLVAAGVSAAQQWSAKTGPTSYVVDTKAGYYYLPNEPAVQSIAPKDAMTVMDGDPRLRAFWPSPAVAEAKLEQFRANTEAWQRAWQYEYDAAWRAMAAADSSTTDTILSEVNIDEGRLGEAADNLRASDASRDEASRWMREFDRRHAATERAWQHNLRLIQEWQQLQMHRLQGPNSNVGAAQ